MIHLPLIAVVDAADGALRRELERLDRYDWIVVTSPAGAERVGSAVQLAPSVRLAAVGRSTANALERACGRSVDLTPEIQRAEALAHAFDEVAPARILLAQADLAAPALAEALRAAGHDVTAVTAYRTVPQRPDREGVPAADAVLFASGSAAESWATSFGSATPPLVIAIGPSTAGIARRFGLKVSSVATDHSLEGLVTELERLHAARGADRDERSRQQR